ncbi:MAG TPA: PTS sugar transporter subunit IIA [bacterium]
MGTSSIGLIVATHGSLAEVLVSTAEFILGKSAPLRPFLFQDNEEPRAASTRLEALIKRCDKGRGVILLVDLFGGTPGSLALSMLQEKSVEVVTGVNLPMVLAAAGLDATLDLAAASASIAAAGRDGIKLAGTLLKPPSR